MGGRRPVVSDLVSVMKNMRLGVNGSSFVDPQFEKKIKAPSEIFAQQFLRIHVLLPFTPRRMFFMTETKSDTTAVAVGMLPAPGP